MNLHRKSIVISAINHQQTSRIPYYFTWEGDIGDQLDAYYGNTMWRERFRNFIQICAWTDDGIYRPGPTYQRDAYGSLWRRDMRPVHLEEPVLTKPSLHGYMFPDPDELFPDNWLRDATANLENCSDCFTVGGIGQGLFERCWALRGFSNTLMDCVAEPAFFEDLCATISEHQIQLIDRLLALPLDGVYLTDDWGDQRGVMIGPERWRKVLKPNIARLYQRIKSADKYVLTHCCGSIADIIPDVIEIGLDVLESVQPEAQDMNPYKLKERYGDQLTFWGGLGSQSIVSRGTPEELRQEIRKLSLQMANRGGYILAPSKSLQPGTPVENAAVILDEFILQGEETNETSRLTPDLTHSSGTEIEKGEEVG